MNGLQTTVARIVGIVLTLVGILGFFADGSLVGFGINPVHNVVHLVTGLIGLWAGFGASGYAMRYNQWLGIVYILVAVLGFVAMGFMETLLNINFADNLLHIVLGVVLAGVGFGMKDAA